MAADSLAPGGTSIRFGLRTLVRGTRDAGVRATWRVLLAWPLLWIVTGGGFTGNVQSAIDAIPAGPTPAGGLAQSLLHAGFFLLALALWARYFDRQPLADYGVSATTEWLLGLFGGFVALVVGFGAWFGLGALVGRTSVRVALSYPEGSLPLAIAMLVVALLLHAAVQQVVFFRVILEAAAEGLRRLGGDPRWAAMAALPVAVGLFIAMHGVPPTGLRFLDLAVAGVVFGLLYLHTDELAHGIGIHFGALFGGSVLFVRSPGAGNPAVFEISGSLPGLIGTLNEYGFPKLVVAYLVLAAWIRWRRGSLSVESATST